MYGYDDPWAQSRATLGMLRGLGLQQQQAQGGIPINGSLGGGQAQLMPAAQGDDIGKDISNAAGKMSGNYMDALLKKRLSQGQPGATPAGADPAASLNRIGEMYKNQLGAKWPGF